MYIFFMYLCGRRLFNCFWTIQIMYSAHHLIIMFYINYQYIHYVCRAGSGMRNIPEHAGVRPISKKWLLLTTVGAGVYTSSDVKLKNVLGQGGVIFIRQFKSNLSLGAGLAVNNTFGYPMVFPAIYFDWSTEGRYQIKVSMLNAMEVSAGMKMNKYLNLRIVAEMNGSLALLEREGKDTMFSQQFIIVGLQPEVSMGNSFSITATAGVSCSRIAYYTTRTLKAFFEDMSKDTDPYFKPAMYVSVGMKYKF